MLKARALLVVLLALVTLAPYTPTARAAGPTGPTAAATSTRALGAGNRIPWQGQDWYFHGANVPWLNWGRDFGGGTKDGVSNRDNFANLSNGFAEAKGNGVNVIRWWTFEGDAWQIKRDGSGMPTGLDESIYADFDKAMDLAEQHDLYYVFVLFSAPQHIPASWMENGGQRAKLASVLGPLFARYKDNPRVMTWEVFNEPEFDVWEKRVKQEPMLATIKEIASSVHANSNAYVTVGGAMLDGLGMMKGLGLDYYQAHWYDYMESGDWCAPCQTYEDVRKKWDLDGPLVIGEIYLSHEIENPQERLENFYAKGYAGAWPWSIFPEATQDKYAIDWNSMRIFAGAHPDLGPRVTDALPLSDAAPTVKLSFKSSASISAQRVSPGQQVTVNVQVTGTADSKALVAIQTYHMSGDEAFKREMDNQSFSPGETKTYSVSWTVPSGAKSGDYVVKVGIFTPGWGKVYDWNDSAVTFTVGR